MTPTSENPRRGEQVGSPTPISPRAAIGIFGGTFDPVHNGHILVADQAGEWLGLDRVLLIPSASPPHRDQPQASARDRFDMVAAAVVGHPRLAASDLEVRRGGISYTLDTLRELRARLPQARLVLLLGWDAALDFGGWHGASEVAAACDLAVMNRAGHPQPDRAAIRAAHLPDATRVLEVDSPDISGTALRTALAAGEMPRELLPDAVVALIRERNLYGPA